MHTHALPAAAQPRVAPSAPARPTTPRPVPTRRTLRRVLATLVLTGAVLLGLSPTAYAHDTLTDSSPAEGETLQQPPTQVHLSFSGEVLEMGTNVIVTDAAGDNWEAGEPTVEGKEVTVPLEDGMPAGSYEVNWRVTSSDGHPISGAIPFTIDAPGQDTTESAPADPAPATATTGPQETEDPAADPAPTTSAASPETTSDEVASDEAASDEAASEQESDSDGSGVPWIPIVVVLGLALVAYAVARVVRRRAPDQGDH